MQPTHRTVIALLAVCTGGVALVAQQPPVFRAEIDSVQLDVRVVDEDGRFVRDLDRGDLQVFEDGQPQTISTFAMVDIPIAGEAGRPSMIPSDVATNAGMNQGRLFVMVLDDLNTHPLRGVTVRQLAKHFVDHNLEEADRLTIITTSGSRTVSQEFTANPVRLHAVIDRFAGHALQPTDSYEFKQTFLNSSYYLVGYTSSNRRRDDRFRRIEVRTTRQGLKVRTRTGYAARNERQAGRAPASAVIETLQSPLAVSGLTLKVAAVPFRGKGSKAAVGVVIHAGGSDVQMAVTAGRFNGFIDVAIAAASADGTIKDSERGTLGLQLTPATRERVAQYGIRLLSRLDLPPGTYHLRVAAVDNGRAMRGSVQYDLDVPDFSKGALSLSGIVLTSDAAAAPLTGDVRFWEQLTLSRRRPNGNSHRRIRSRRSPRSTRTGRRPVNGSTSRLPSRTPAGPCSSRTARRNRSMRRRESRQPIATSHRFTFRPSHPAPTS